MNQHDPMNEIKMRLNKMDEHLVQIRIEIAMLKMKSSIWGGITGLIVAGIVTAAFNLPK